MDAFHTLAADGLIEGASDHRNLMPFTWALGRLFKVTITAAGAGLLLARGGGSGHRSGFRLVVGTSLVFGAVAYAVTHASVTSGSLPQTMFPEAVITRPYDALPLLLFAFVGLVIYPRLLRRAPSLFTHALVLSAVPEVATQLHMTFGSTALFDNHFNVAHFTKLVAYVLPLTGLTLDYVRAHESLRGETAERKLAEQALSAGEERERAILENMVEALVTIDKRGRIERVNPATVSMFGYPSEELIGRNVALLMPEPDRSRHDGYLARYHETGEKRIIGIGREVVGRRKDGSTFPIDLSVAETALRGRRFYTGIMRDISERKRMERLKSEFISTVSHELRTPLTSIRGSLGLIAGGAVGAIPASARGMLDIAKNNTERLLILINDILDMEKMESGRMAFKFKAVAIPELVESALAANVAYAEQHEVRLVCAQPLDAAWVFADPDRLLQVMANLLSNAAKFSPAGSEVQVTVARHEGCLRISVADRGAGIPEEFWPKVFERFTQSDASDTRRVGGTGLGLSISKVIVERHGGRIGFVSRDGAGTTFFFDLPEMEAADGVERQPPEPLETDEPGILILEDDPDVAGLLRRMLVAEGFNADVAHTIAAARRKLAGTEYRAVTLDLNLPDGDGLLFLRELRSAEGTRDIPVVVVSVRADAGRQALSGGVIDVVDWLSKPLDGGRLVDAVRRAVAPDVLPKVLHVEDDADVHRVVGTLLAGRAEVVWARSLQEARTHLSGDEAFQLVLLDVGLPDGSGLSLLDGLQNAYPAVPVVIFSAQEVEESVASQVGAALVKSATSNPGFVAAIQQALHRRRG